MTFAETVRAAVADFAEHGYDEEERLSRWLTALRTAADAEAMSPGQLRRNLEATLRNLYKRMVDDGGLARVFKGLDRFTLAKLAPRLRTELDRRVLAGANLIKNNREEAVSSTLRRFSGWATSIPPGGSAEPSARDAQDTVKKALRQLPYAERRVAIDQGHKFTAAVHAVVAEGTGAIAGRWASNWRQAGYDYREDHKERDGQVYLLRDSWAKAKGYVKPGAAGYADGVTQPGEEPMCFPGDSKVPITNGVHKAFRRWYSGELTTLVTESGKTLRATPNHPVLTQAGWKAVGSLNVGDYIFEISNDALSSTTEKYKNQGVSLISDIFCSLYKTGVIQSLNLTPAAFHGDGSDGHVDVVTSNWSLMLGGKTKLQQRLHKFCFPMANSCGSALRYLLSSVFSMWTTSCSIVRGSCQNLSFFISQPAHSQAIGFRDGARINSHAFKSRSYNRSTDSQLFRNKQNTFTFLKSFHNLGGVCTQTWFFNKLWKTKLVQMFLNSQTANLVMADQILDRVPFGAKLSKLVKVENACWTGHVYNLETMTGWYVTENFITHNCRCKMVYIFNLRDLPADMLTQAGRDALEEVRQKRLGR